MLSFFIDPKKAYSSVPRSAFGVVLETLGVPQGMLQLGCCMNTSVQVGNGITRPFLVQNVHVRGAFAAMVQGVWTHAWYSSAGKD